MVNVSWCFLAEKQIVIILSDVNNLKEFQRMMLSLNSLQLNKVWENILIAVS